MIAISLETKWVTVRAGWPEDKDYLLSWHEILIANIQCGLVSVLYFKSRIK